jgi:hypothetical protein
MLLGFSWLHAQEDCSPQAPDIVVTSTPLGPSGAYLWGQQVEIDVATGSPYSGESYVIEYSLDAGESWIPAAPNVTDFPVTISLPAFMPPPYDGTLEIRAVAVCNGTNEENQGRSISINLSDRQGNRPTIPIRIRLNSSGSGTWVYTTSDSTNGLATSDEYNDAKGARWGSYSRDLFFLLELPECLDSLVVNTCSENTDFNTRIHFINATTNDTITNDDQGSSCNIQGGSLLSQLVVFGLPNALRVTQTERDDIGFGNSAKVVRDTALLVSGNTLYIVVEGSFLTDQGKFELTITGYKLRPSSINVSGAPNRPVCINSDPITLDATTPGATAYQWLDANGDPIREATSATYIIDPNAEGSITVSAVAIFNPNGDPNCATSSDSVASSPITITVEDTARAQIVDAADDNNVLSNTTLSITAGSTVTLKAKSSQNPDNSYIWKQYNSIPPPPSGTPDFTSTDNPLIISNISAGSYTVVLEAVRGTGACGTTRDTVYLNVTTGLRTDAGTFSIFPNPNTGAFTIVAPAMDTYRVQVLDVAGRLVAEDAFTGSTHQMRLSLPAGVYQIRLVAGEKAQIGRLIITE